MTEEIGNDQKEIIVEFVNEAQDLIDDLEPTIISLDEMVQDKPGTSLSNEETETLNSIFRLFHSMKGGAGFLGFNNIVKSTHTAENLLDQLRNSEFALTATHVDLLCSSCDFAKEALSYVEENFEDSGFAELSDELIKKFETALSNTTEAPASTITKKSPETNGESSVIPSQQESSAPPEINLLSLENLVNPETRNKFQEESDDIVQEIEEDLLHLSSNPDNLSPVERLFRNVHSFKGNCGFLGFKDLEKLLHTEETLLETIKDGTLKKVSKVTDMLLELLDVVKETLTNLSNEGTGAVSGLDLYIEIMNNYLPQELQVQTDAPSTMLGDILVQQGAVLREDLDNALNTQKKTIGEILVDSGAVREEQVEKALKVQKILRPKGSGQQSSKLSTKRQDIRVDLDKLDNLINLIGEMSTLR